MAYALSTLPTGLRVASEHLPGMESVAVAVSVDVGARYETASQMGVSHVLEHMAFKGTRTRTARRIAEEFDEIGGNLNAYTSHEHTVYYARVLAADMPKAVEILADIMEHSTFPAEELERERNVILQEIAMQQDSPDDLVFDLFQETAFAAQPLGRSILGTPGTVSSFQRADIAQYITAHYRPAQMVWSAAGNVEHAAFESLVKQHVKNTHPPRAKAPVQGHYTGGEKQESKELEQSHVVLGFPCVDARHENYYASQLLALLLGGGMSSRLFQEVREKRGLAYTVSAFAQGYNDAGLFGVYAATSEDKLKELLPVLCEEMKKLSDTLTEAELTRARNQHIASLLMARESASTVAEWIGRHLLVRGVYWPATEMARRIQAVTLQEVRQLAEWVLRAAPLTRTVLGPTGGLEEYEQTQARLK